MPMPPLDFLLDSSLTSLQELELAALNRSANIGKSLRVELEGWIEQEAVAKLSRWLIENREAIANPGAQPKRLGFEDLLENPERKRSA